METVLTQSDAESADLHDVLLQTNRLSFCD